MYNNHRLRPLRNNYRGRLAIGKRNEEDPPESNRRSLRRISLLATPRGSSSSSSEEDEEMYTSKRRRRMLPRTSRTREALERSTRSKSKRLTMNTSSNPEGASSFDGIRRSTRKRNLKFENVNDSWIVGAQSLKGYPDFSRDYVNVKKETEEDEDEDDENEREEDEEEEEDEETEQRTKEENGSVLPRRRRILRMESQPKRRARPARGSARPVAGALEEEDDDEESRDGSSEEGVDDEKNPDDTFQDMYARVKQRRRAAQQQTRSSESLSTDEEAPPEGRRTQRRPPPPRRTRNREDREEQGDNNVQKYSLRQKKPTVQRFQIEAPPNPFRDVILTRRKKRRRRSSSSSTSSSSSGDRDRRDRRKKRLELVGAESKADTGKLNADTGLMTLDQSIRFNNIGGLEKHINSLKEMILFPILYPEIFNKFGVTPPKGVLFHGPPGTGKTLMARALANECSQGNRKVSFFMRKGADVLSKWVGESERQLRLLFQEAHQGRPSIIFFDELDGLAPVRSSKQDQIHSSIVCTLLALMDGLDNRGDIIIIGATNRIDSIDPALRRPGRFDRELHFPLPGVKERREILGIHAKWADPDILNKMAEVSAGYCGSDLKALCTESVIHSLKRVYPQIYSSNRKLLLNNEKVKVERVDFEQALRVIVPSAHRSWAALGRKMPPYLDPILGQPLAALLSYVGDVFPMAFNRRIGSQQVSRSPRLLLVGDNKATSILSSSLLYKLEHCPVLNVAFDTLYTEPGRSPEEVLKQVFKELPHRSGCILWFGDVSLWWSSTSSTVKATFDSLVSQMDPSLPILYLGTSREQRGLPHQVNSLFKRRLNEVYVVPKATREQRETFFRPIFRIKALKPPPKPKPKKEEMEMLVEAPPTPPPKLTDEQLDALKDEEENTLRELRIFLRQICAKLARNKQFYMFSKPVDINEVPDYLQVIKEPMDLETMMTKIDHLEYTCAQDFLNDIDLLCTNALEYNPDRDPADKQIRHRACYLRDTAYALIKAEMDSDFEINCRQIRDDRKKRAQVDDGQPVDAIKTEVEAKEDRMETDSQTPTKNPTDVSNSKGTPPNSNSLTSSLKKKRRKTSSWCKGFIAKKARKTSGDSVASSSSRAEGTVGDPMCHSTPQRVQPPSSTHPANAVDSAEGLNESVTASEDARNETLNGYITGATEETEEEIGDAPKKVKADREALNRLLVETVELTGHRNNAERLIDLHGSLSRVIESYLFKWDRTHLVQDLRHQLKKFEEDITSDEESVTTQDGM